MPAMPLFRLNHKQVELIKEQPFKYEQEIKETIEENLKQLLGLQYVRSEFQIGTLRIDTLAYDNESKSFVIIEYKKDRNFSVVDQGMSYLGLMLNNKADFILEYNEKCNSSLRREDIDWSQSRVVFISPAFTTYQVESINFKDLPIELWEVHRYSNNTIGFTQHKPTSANATIKSVSKRSKMVDDISREVKKYTEDDHLIISTPEIIELYNRYKDMVLLISPDITLKPMKKYIAFRAKSNVTDVVLQKKSLKIFINLTKGKLEDPKNLAQDVSKVGHWGNGDYQIQISDDDNLEYIISLVRQSYKNNS
jgi:predicted transport protein